MLLQSIELQNFRQFINEKIDFSTDPERNVTLIILLAKTAQAKPHLRRHFSGVFMVKLISPIKLCSIESLLSR